MLGRCDILAGMPQEAFKHSPDSGNNQFRQMNCLRNILNARNAIIHADANHVVKSCVSRTLGGRAELFFPIDSSVGIAPRKRRIGTFRAVAHMQSNLIPERAGRLFKWPKFKTSLRFGESDEVEIPNLTTPKKLPRAEKSRSSNNPPGWAGRRAVISSDEESVGSNIDWSSMANIEKELDDLLLEDQRLADEQSGRTGMSSQLSTYYHNMPIPSYTNGRPLMCPNTTIGEEMEIVVNHATCLPAGGPNLIWTLSSKSKPQKEKESKVLRENVWYDDDIVGQFDPSRIPPRISFRLQKARDAIIKEIGDLLTPHGQGPPAMLEINMDDVEYKGIARAHSTLVVKRKSFGVYKGRLCVRGDTVPIAQMAFVSSPAANRCGVEIICLVASKTQWRVHALDVSQAFLQVGNLQPNDRAIAIPPQRFSYHGRNRPIVSIVTSNQRNHPATGSYY